MRAAAAGALSATTSPRCDPTPIFEIFRGSYGTELLTAAVTHFRVIERLAAKPMSFQELRAALKLQDRPAHVLVTALRAFGLITLNAAGQLVPTLLGGEHLLPGAPFDVSSYIGLEAGTRGVLEMIERLTTNRPANAEASNGGAAFIFREGMPSAMEQEASARHFTLALAGRAKNVAPALAASVDLSNARLLLDIGGGTGIYSIACLQRYPGLRAIVWDRPGVLKIATEMAADYGVSDRLECRAGDMFADPVPSGADAILLSNVLHDWDVPTCQQLLDRCAAALGPGGQLLIHDVFLDDDLGGPLPIALYSAALFTLTEGRAYSAAEYRLWLSQAGLQPGSMIPTLVHCGVLCGTR